MIPEHPHRSEALAAKSQTSCRLALPYGLALFQEEGTGLSPCRDFRKPQNASGSASPHSSVAVLSPKDETHSSVLSSIDPTFSSSLWLWDLNSSCPQHQPPSLQHLRGILFDSLESHGERSQSSDLGLANKVLLGLSHKKPGLNIIQEELFLDPFSWIQFLFPKRKEGLSSTWGMCVHSHVWKCVQEYFF